MKWTIEKNDVAAISKYSANLIRSVGANEEPYLYTLFDWNQKNYFENSLTWGVIKIEYIFVTVMKKIFQLQPLIIIRKHDTAQFGEKMLTFIISVWQKKQCS